MDLHQLIHDLRTEREQIDTVIRDLELLQSAPGPLSRPILPVGRRGRKSMGVEERQQVSKRMKEYWAKRRHRVSDPKRSV